MLKKGASFKERRMYWAARYAVTCAAVSAAFFALGFFISDKYVAIGAASIYLLVAGIYGTIVYLIRDGIKIGLLLLSVYAIICGPVLAVYYLIVSNV